MSASRSAIILASASPRRRDILSSLRIPFEVQPSGADENSLPMEDHLEFVRAAGAVALDPIRDGRYVELLFSAKDRHLVHMPFTSKCSDTGSPNTFASFGHSMLSRCCELKSRINSDRLSPSFRRLIRSCNCFDLVSKPSFLIGVLFFFRNMSLIRRFVKLVF